MSAMLDWRNRAHTPRPAYGMGGSVGHGAYPPAQSGTQGNDTGLSGEPQHMQRDPGAGKGGAGPQDLLRTLASRNYAPDTGGSVVPPTPAGGNVTQPASSGFFNNNPPDLLATLAARINAANVNHRAFPPGMDARLYAQNILNGPQ